MDAPRRRGADGPDPHDPQRHHPGAAALPAAVPLAAVRPGEPGGGGRRCSPSSAPPTGSTATSPATSTRCRTSARSSTRSPTGCCSSSAVVAILIDGARARCGSAIAVARARGRWSPSRPLVARGLRGPPHRRHVVGKAGTFCADVRLPAVPAGRAHGRRRCTTSPTSLAWVLRHPRPRPQLLRRRSRTSRSASQALREGRADRRRARRGGAGMKAVIMAGGEGTRLRPLTSNAPKPMMPLANGPMMEHIVDLLRRHGFDEIVVTVAFLANHIRNYFGDGSEFGVRDGLRHRGDAARHRRLGAQRHGRARRALPRHLRRRAHRHRPRRASSTFHDEQEALATIGLDAGREPARVRHRHHPRGRLASSASSRSRRGARCSATPSTPASSCSSPRSSTTSPPDRSVDFSGEVFPALLDDGQAALRRRRRGLLGGRRHARGLPRAPTRTSSTARSQVDIPGFEIGDGVWLGEGAEVHPDASIDGPGRHRRQLPGRGRRPPRRRTPCSAPTSGCGPTPTSSAPSCTTTPTSARACACGARSIGRACDLRRGVRCEEGVGARRRVLRRRARGHQPPA